MGKVRSKLWLGAMLGMLMIVLAACSANQNTNHKSNETTAQVGQTAANETTAEQKPTTRVIKTVKGDIEIPADPNGL